MSDRAQLLLDEHVGRVFERVLRERGYHVDQAKDLFGERTTDTELLQWCGEHDAVLVSNNGLAPRVNQFVSADGRDIRYDCFDWWYRTTRCSAAVRPDTA
jgi:hypothetical protein